MVKYYDCAPAKEEYWAKVQKKVNAMNDKQLVWLYNMHSDFLLKPSKNENYQMRRYETFNELTYRKIKKFTSPVNYPTLMHLIDLILVGYNYKELHKILFDIDLDAEDDVA